MKRIDRIYNYIENSSKKFTKDKLLEVKGFSAQEIGEHLEILRSNVSRELNTLCRDSKIIKIKNRPVLYFDRKSFEEILSVKLPDDLEEISDIMKFASSEDVVRDEEQSPFNYLIGANTSLKNQIEQAKAALLYPPNGLHTLIIGSTGVGKSLFVNIMYQYSKYIKSYLKMRLLLFSIVRITLIIHNYFYRIFLDILRGLLQGLIRKKRELLKRLMEEYYS